jgi:hypothetical protein
MARTRAAIWSAKTGSTPAGRLSPCRTALRDDRALPSGVFGPRLRRPFLRLASRLASLIMPAPVACSCFVLSRVQRKGKQNALAANLQALVWLTRGARRAKGKLMAAADENRLSLDADRAEQKGRKMAVPVMNDRLGMNGRFDMSSSLGRAAGAGLVEPCYSGGWLTSRRLAVGFGFGPWPPSAAVAVLTRRGAFL